MKQSGSEVKHPLQRLMDNPWVLLLLGLVVPFLSYSIWAWIEIARIPKATLP